MVMVRSLGAGDPRTTDAQRTLLRMMRSVLADEGSCREVLRSALGRSGVAALPTRSAALVEFAREHLAVALSRVIGPHLALAFLEELEADLESQREESGVGRRRVGRDAKTLPRIEIASVRSREGRKDSGVR